jgi:hypothetical protein
MMEIESIIGKLPYRLALAGGWIDQPFISKHNPNPPGSMVVVAVNPTYRFMSKCGLGTSTRSIARQLWRETLPDEDPQVLMRQLYHFENADRTDPSGSQDMAGILFPGINRLDYDYNFEGGVFPVHVESNNNPHIAAWLENHLHILPVNQRPEGYYPLGIKNFATQWITRLAQTGKDCFKAILAQDAQALGETMNETMRCWEAILPHVVRHPTITMDLMQLLAFYQSRYYGAMFSGCGGGYFYIVSDEPVPGTFTVNIRISSQGAKPDG